VLIVAICIDQDKVVVVQRGLVFLPVHPGEVEWPCSKISSFSGLPEAERMERSMSIILPDFKDRKCLEVSICGFISEPDYVQKVEVLPLEKLLIATYERSGQKVFARMVPPFPLDEDKDVHIHIELDPASGKSQPRVNCSIDDILNRLDTFVGQKINIRVAGTFRTNLAELPSFIRPLLMEYGDPGKVQVRMTGGTLAVQGAPIQRISWQLLDKEGGARITLEARTEVNLSESYLVDQLDMLESAFNSFIVGEKQ
jgi:hypothetical protein